MKPIFLFCTLFIAALQASSQQQAPVKKQKWHWQGDQDTIAGYAQVVKVDNVLYISGTVSTEITPAGISRLYSAIEKSLQQFGAGFQHVVKENLYTTDIEEMKKHNDVRKAFYKDDFPAATWVQVSRLFMADAKLEVEVIAHLPK